MDQGMAKLPIKICLCKICYMHDIKQVWWHMVVQHLPSTCEVISSILGSHSTDFFKWYQCLTHSSSDLEDRARLVKQDGVQVHWLDASGSWSHICVPSNVPIWKYHQRFDVTTIFKVPNHVYTISNELCTRCVTQMWLTASNVYIAWEEPSHIPWFMIAFWKSHLDTGRRW